MFAIQLWMSTLDYELVIKRPLFDLCIVIGVLHLQRMTVIFPQKWWYNFSSTVNKALKIARLRRIMHRGWMGW